MKPQYRPCIVTEIIYPPYGEQGIIEHKEHKALFHGWVKRILPYYEIKSVGMYDFISKKYIGNDEILIAVVEYKDGTIHEHSMQEIQFTNSKEAKN